MGSVDFVDDMTSWLGVELDTALGRHDGTVQVRTLSRATCYMSRVTCRMSPVHNNLAVSRVFDTSRPRVTVACS